MLERAGHDLPVHLDLLGRAVQGGIDVPGAQVLVLLDLLEHRVGRRAWLLQVIGAAGVAGGRFPEHAGDHHRVRNDLGNAQRTDEFDDLANVAVLVELDLEGLDDRWLGHQPETHLGADAVVGLGEHAVQRWAITPFEDLPGLVALDAAHAGAQHVAVGQHHFHAALHQEVFAIRRVAHTPVHGVADRTGNAGGCRKRQHQRQFVVFDVVVELLVGHARLDQCGAKLRVNMDDLVHQPQVQHDLTALAGRSRSIAKIATGRDGPDGHFVGIANLQDRLDFFHRLGE